MKRKALAGKCQACAEGAATLFACNETKVLLCMCRIIMEAAMALTRAQMDAKIDQHFGFEARDDVEGVLATLTPDAEHDIVGSPTGITHGREAARGFYVNLFGDLADGKVECLRRLYGENFLVDESLWRGRAVGRPFGIEGKNRPLEFRLLHVIEYAESGDMKREQVWIDLAAIQQQLA